MSSDSLGKGCGTKLEGMRDVVALCSWCITPITFPPDHYSRFFFCFGRLRSYV
jgi:hypothetical protein